jgi:hypothetical protein
LTQSNPAEIQSDPEEKKLSSATVTLSQPESNLAIETKDFEVRIKAQIIVEWKRNFHKNA